MPRLKHTTPRPPAGGRRAQQKAETRQLVLESAKALFEEQGFERTTIRAIARRAGVGLGTIFGHFPDKASLLIAALLDDLGQVQGAALASMPAQVSFREQCLHFVGSFYAYYARRPELSQTLLKEFLFVGGDWGAKVRQDALAGLDLGAGMLELAKSRGEIGAGVDCRLAAMAIFATYLGVLYAGLSQPQVRPREMLEHFSRMLDQLLAGIGPRRA
ncbi:MAG: helix-turn-helix domain-containing protein [Pseudomonadota bacterium]